MSLPVRDFSGSPGVCSGVARFGSGAPAGRRQLQTGPDSIVAHFLMFGLGNVSVMPDS